MLGGVLGLEKDVGARDHAGAIGGGQALADTRLEVMPPLVRGVDAPKAR
jgi:hypothetical protein